MAQKLRPTTGIINNVVLPSANEARFFVKFESKRNTADSRVVAI